MIIPQDILVESRFEGCLCPWIDASDVRVRMRQDIVDKP
jgi:hypothetical protein